jgi:membrane fusion protein (multidrug efflux system)
MAVAAAASALCLCACSRGETHQAKPVLPDATYVVIHTASAAETEDLPGKTEAYAVSDIRPQVSGKLEARLFTEGSSVDAGQPLYQIDRAPYQAAFDGAAAILQNAQDNLALAEGKAKRYAELLNQSAISKQDFDSAQAAYKQAATIVAQQKASLDNAQFNLDNTIIRSPIAGYIGRSFMTPGTLVTAYQTNALATVETLNPIYVDIAISSNRLTALKQKLATNQKLGNGSAAAQVQLQLDDGTTYPLEGKLPFTNITFDREAGKVVLRALFPNPKLALSPGMNVRVTYSDGTNNDAIFAPKSAIARDAGGEAVALVIDARDIVRRRILKIDNALGEMCLVMAGLTPGDRLVVKAPRDLAPDMPVHPVPAAPPSS